jgi:hypothetical protein
LDEHLHILALAARGGLPRTISEDSDIPFSIVRELIEAGHLVAVDISSHDGFAFRDPRITLSGREYLNANRPQREASPEHRQLLTKLERMRDIMVAVATGGPRIDEVNSDYRELYAEVDEALRLFGIENTIPFPDLWDWYGRWRSGDLPSYQSRRELLANLFLPLLDQVRQHGVGRVSHRAEPTGWPRVDRVVGEARDQLAQARNEEQFQAIGLLCREILISLGQAVYDPQRHALPDGAVPSETDAKRMIDAFIGAELPGTSNEVARRHARAAYSLAVELQHRRTATFRDAALCLEATSSVVNSLAIISGRRDPA